MNLKCECHKINWNFCTYVHTYKDNNEIVNQLTSFDCQSKVNRNEMSICEYEIICKFKSPYIYIYHDDNKRPLKRRKMY